MKALSLTQPWATLVADGHKTIETRSWATGYRGLVAIHATKGFPKDARDICGTEPFRSILRTLGYKLPMGRGGDRGDLPLGAILAVARLVEVRRTNDWQPFSEWEQSFGNYSPGRFAWVLMDVIKLASPVYCAGALGLWTVDADLLGKIVASIPKETSR